MEGIFSLLERFVRRHPTFYGPIRSEFASWVLHQDDPELSQRAREFLERMVEWFEGHLESTTQDNEPHRWDGKIVFQHGAGLKVLDTATGEMARVPITVRGDFAEARPRWEEVGEALRQPALSPTGKRAVFEARGEIYGSPDIHDEDTARAIADDLGLGRGVITGKEFDALSDEELTEQVPNLHVFGRVSPQDKLRLVDSMQATGQVVAMTGDAVNDAAAQDRDRNLQRAKILLRNRQVWDVEIVEDSPYDPTSAAIRADG